MPDYNHLREDADDMEDMRHRDDVEGKMAMEGMEGSEEKKTGTSPKPKPKRKRTRKTKVDPAKDAHAEPKDGEPVPYVRLPFSEYYIICSRNYTHQETHAWLAEYSEIVYRHGRHTHRVNYQVRYDHVRHCIQAIFQQTADRSDWRANFEFAGRLYREPLDLGGGKTLAMRVHRGWGDMWRACKKAVRQEISLLLKEHPEAHIEVFGWSLGSAIAQICAEDVFYQFSRRPYLYTYGSVRPFAGRKTWRYVQGCCEKAYCFYDACDIVGYMVPFPWYRAIRHYALHSERFGIMKLFNPWKFHTLYGQEWLYDGIDEYDF